MKEMSLQLYNNLNIYYNVTFECTIIILNPTQL